MFRLNACRYFKFNFTLNPRYLSIARELKASIDASARGKLESFSFLTILQSGPPNLTVCIARSYFPSKACLTMSIESISTLRARNKKAKQEKSLTKQLLHTREREKRNIRKCYQIKFAKCLFLPFKTFSPDTPTKYALQIKKFPFHSGESGTMTHNKTF